MTYIPILKPSFKIAGQSVFRRWPGIDQTAIIAAGIPLRQA
jgi:hypothetical protein